MWKSTDGGHEFHEITTPHGDNHDLWIDPKNNRRMVQGNDGGGNVSFNAGRTWSSIYNQLTAQFYRMDVDNQFPYRVYQQHNIDQRPNATEWGVVTMSDCTLPGTGESGFIAVHPEDPNIVLYRRRRLVSRRLGRAAALRPSDAPDTARQCLAGRGHRHRAQGPALPLRLDLPDPVFSARCQRALCLRQSCLPQPRRRPQLGGDQPRPDAARRIQAGSLRRSADRRQRRRRDLCDTVDAGRIAAPQGRIVGRHR